MKFSKLTIFLGILDFLALVCFFVFYGPFTWVKNTLISTAMITKTHQYLAYTFYSEEDINKILEANSYIPIDEEVNLDDIVINTSSKDYYENEYEEMILERDEDEDYKYIQVKVGKYDAHLVAIYDPSKVKVITSTNFNTGSSMEKIKYMCTKNNGKVCINAGGFLDPDGWGSDIPQGTIIKDGAIVWSDSDEASDLIGFTNDDKLILTHMSATDAIKNNIRDAIEFGPFLIVNGESIQFNSEAGGYDRAARVAIAQRKDGIVLFLVTEGVHTNGPNLKEVVDTLLQYGAYNAANLDGGTSAQLVIEGELINTPLTVTGTKVVNGRGVVSGFGFIP